jgi:hypothetical protein
MVRLAGLEPARIAPLPPQSSVSANSTISATAGMSGPINEAGRPSIRKSNPAMLITLHYGVAAQKTAQPITGSDILLLKHDTLESHGPACRRIDECAAHQSVGI